jgi:hypothetical protein
LYHEAEQVKAILVSLTSYQAVLKHSWGKTACHQTLAVAITHQMPIRRPMLNRIRLLRRLLELDRNFPALNDAEVATEVERLFPWNFWTNLLDGVSFWFGMTFMSTGTILALFISKLTPDPRAVGLMAAIAQAGWFLPQESHGSEPGIAAGTRARRTAGSCAAIGIAPP